MLVGSESRMRERTFNVRQSDQEVGFHLHGEPRGQAVVVLDAYDLNPKGWFRVDRIMN